MPYLYGDDINKLQGRPIVGLSHAAGYACGYHLVKYFLQKTNIPIEVATTLNTPTKIIVQSRKLIIYSLNQ